jgi:hypothetical protein
MLVQRKPVQKTLDNDKTDGELSNGNKRGIRPF